MTRVLVECVTMEGNQYVLYAKDGAPAFPHGEADDGEAPAHAVKRIVEAWTGTKDPKLELVDMLAAPGALTLVFRAMLVAPPQGSPTRAPRMGLPARVGALEGRYVEEALKTSLAYKLTRG